MALICLFIYRVVILFDSAYCDKNGVSLNNEDILGLKNEVKSLREEMTKYKSIIDVLLKTSAVKGKSSMSKLHQRRQEPDTRVAFTSCIGVGDLVNLGNHQTVVFDQVITNHGNAYHTTTGIFRAPISGVYAFHFSAMSSPHHQLYFEIMRDGQVVDDVLSDATSSTTWESVGEMWTLELSQGAEVWIRTKTYPESPIGQIHGTCHTMFSGYFLFEI